MIQILIFILAAIISYILYLYYFKEALIEIIFINGFIFGISFYKEYFDESTTNFIDFSFGFVIISVSYDC